MSKQRRPNWLQARPRQNDLKEVWVAGYGMTLVTDFTPDIDVSEDSVGVYGYSGTIDTKIVNAGTIAMSGIFDDTMQTLFDVASNVDPSYTSGIRGNYPQSVYLDVVRLTKDPTKRYYEYCELFPKVNFVLTPSGGGPKDKPTFSFNGRCDVPIGFKAASGKGLSITWDTVKLTTGSSSITGNFTTYQPTQVPLVPGYEGSQKFALLCEIQRRTTDTGDSGAQVVERSAYIPVTATNITTGSGGTTKGTVTITETDLLGTGISISDVNSAGKYLFAFVCFLYETDPVANPSTYYLLADTVEVRGRFDVPG